MIEPLCRLCLEAGCVTPATVADHVAPHRGDFTAFRLGALRSLCADCHNRLDDTSNAPRNPVREDGTPSTRTILGTPAPRNPQMPTVESQPMTAEQAAKLKRLAEAAYELDAFKLNLTRAEADQRIAALAAKLKLLGEPPHTL